MRARHDSKPILVAVAQLCGSCSECWPAATWAQAHPGAPHAPSHTDPGPPVLARGTAPYFPQGSSGLPQVNSKL